jgi:hypothetical protein
MSQNRISISIGECYKLYLANLSMKPHDRAEKILLESDFPIIQNFESASEEQQLALESAQVIIRKRLANLIKNVKKTNWRTINN